MNPQLITTSIYIIVGGIILFGLVRLANRPKKCAVCGTVTREPYTDSHGKTMYLCRNHLVAQWNTDMQNSSVNMIVIEPDFDSCPHGYLYADAIKLKKWNHSNAAVENVNKILAGIPGHTCASCDQAATVAYFKKEDYTPPLLEKISATPTYLCKKCTLKTVSPLILYAKKPLVEGLDAPLATPGIFHVQEF